MATPDRQKRQDSSAATASDDDVRREGSTFDGEIPPRFDAGSGERETDDGLDQNQEAARHGAEDIPASEKPEDIDRVPVFDRAGRAPRV
jgi:hypothetical protein